MEYSVRSYDEKRDYDFVWDLHLKENISYINRHLAGTSLETIQGWFDESIPTYQGYIVEQKNERIGCYFLKEKDQSIFLRSFFLIDRVQNKGLGSELFSKMLSQFAATNKPFEIMVWTDNPVQNFWYKKGFIHYETDEDNLMKLRLNKDKK